MMDWTIFKDTIEWLSQLFTIIFSLCGIWLTILGLHSWKKQVVWQNNYNLAKEILLHIYKIDECIERIRFIGGISSSEDRTVRDEIGDGADNDTVFWYAINKRFEKADNLSNELRILQLQAKSFLTPEIVESINKFRIHYKVLGIVFLNKHNILMHGRSLIENSKDPLFNSANKYTPFAMKSEDDLYYKELATIIDNLESELKPYLKIESIRFFNIVKK